ncbi:MAG: peptidase M64, partial [Candidatus Krumholzibacteria bacterium]|nr:peptidase M64 [Candidatus Krumholzibacteria bacterium]
MRRFFIALFAIILFLPLHAEGRVDFDRFFTRGALRIDLFHTGTSDTEIYSLDEMIEQPFWAGNPRALLDTLNLGGYLLRVYDLATNALIYSRGYCSIFGEWVTTDEAREGIARTFHESLIMPYPRKPVQVRIDRRDKHNIFRNVFDLVVDPSDYHIRKGRRYGYFRVRKLRENGPTGRKIDIVILGDGYRKDQVHKLRKDVERFLNSFFGTEPFKSRRDDFNVRLIESISEESGVDNPREEVYTSSILGLSFNSLDIDRYMLTTSNKALRDIAANVPYDQIIILANTEKYGGGGIFNLYSTCCSDNEYDGYIFVHEFGHAFAGLADEYYSSSVTYNDMYPRGVEPWEPNITALLDTTDVKWGDL